MSNLLEGAPEHVRDENDDFTLRSIRSAKPSKDIWSLGCVFSEAVYWSVFGPKGHRDYQDARRRLTVQPLKDTGYSGYFHNGHSIHDTVSDHHRYAIQGRRMNIDDIVSNIVAIIEEMLGDEPSRPNALDVHRRLSKTLDLVRAPIRSPSSGRYSTSIRLPTNGSGTRMPPPIPPDGNALGLDLGSPFGSPTVTASDMHINVSLAKPTQPRFSFISHHGHTSPDIPAVPRGKRPSNDENVASQRFPHNRTSRHDHSPTTDHFNNKAFELASGHAGQAGGVAQMPPDLRGTPSADRDRMRQLNPSESQTPVPTATVSDVLDWIDKRSFPSEIQNWLGRLHGRDQVHTIMNSHTISFANSPLARSFW
jgi:serine/threonine protein kinase